MRGFKAKLARKLAYGPDKVTSSKARGYFIGKKGTKTIKVIDPKTQDLVDRTVNWITVVADEHRRKYQAVKKAITKNKQAFIWKKGAQI